MGNALKKVLVVSACALAAVFAWADRFDGVVRGKGAADPEGYAPVLVANGELAMPIDWNFGVRRDKCRQYSQGIYLEGRRVSHPKRELLPQGHWNRKLFVDGRPAGAPVRWEQKLDTANGTVTCTVEHPEGLVFTGEAFVPRSGVTGTFRFAVRPEVVGSTLPPGVRIVEKKGDRVILEVDSSSMAVSDRFPSGANKDFLC